MSRPALSGGFADPVRAAQATFRALADALSRPGRPVALTAAIAPPAPLTPELAVIAATLADADTSLWLDESLAASGDVADWLRFHTGARITGDRAEATFALVAHPAALPPLGAFAFGSDAYPDRSTTLVLAVDGFDGAPAVRLSGPGLAVPADFAVRPLGAAFWAAVAATRGGFPRGLDLFFAGAGAVAGLPRSTRLAVLDDATVEAEPCT